MIRKGIAALVLFLSLLAPCILSAATLHAILVGDSLDVDLRLGILADLREMTQEVKTIAEQTGMKLHSITINEEQVTVENLLNELNTLSVNPDDAILLYFSGHGFRLQEKKDRWPYLYFNPESEGVDFLDLCQFLKRKKPRLLVAMADCCNNFIDLEEEEESRLLERAIRLGDRKKNYQKLFLHHRGTIIVSSSIPGQTSVGSDRGGLFTRTFLKELNEFVTLSTSEVEWDKLLRSVGKKVSAAYPQTPQFELQ
jgi:hypothetical protein